MQMYDFSNTFANIDFSILHIDYNAKYNFKSCNIRNLDKLDTYFLMKNINSFDEKTINENSHLFKLDVIDLESIKIKYLKTEDGRKKAKEIAKYLEDKIDLFSDIKEINILNSASNYNNGILNININYNVKDIFNNILRNENGYYKNLLTATQSLKEKNEYELIYLKTNVLNNFNGYFNDKNYKIDDRYIIELLYIEQDYKMLSDYLKNRNIEQVIDKYFEILFSEIINYYFDNISDVLLLENLDYIYSLTSSFDFNLFINKTIDDVSPNFNNKISNEEIINISKHILKRIDGTGELLEIFIKKLEEKRIILYTDKKEYPKFFKYDKEKDNNSFYLINEDVILCHNENSYDTVVTLIHEFIHMYSNLKGKDNHKKNPYFQEIASIFFENIAIDYLSKMFSVDKEQFKIATEREIVNNANIIGLVENLGILLEQVKIKKERNLKFSDFFVNVNTSDFEELFNLFKPKDDYKEYLARRDKYDNYREAYKKIGFAIRGILYKDYYSLINTQDKVLISYILGTRISKISLEDDRFIDLFLFISKNAESDKYSENDLFKIMIDTINKYKQDENIESKTK